MAVRRTLAKRSWKRGLETAAAMVASEPGRQLKTRRWREAGCCNRRAMAATGAPFARRHSNSTPWTTWFIWRCVTMVSNTKPRQQPWQRPWRAQEHVVTIPELVC